MRGLPLWFSLAMHGNAAQPLRAGFFSGDADEGGHGPDAETVARFCFTNPDTAEQDIQAILDAPA